MTIQKIIGEHGLQDELCNGSGCPAAILTEGGEAFVQGYLPDQQTRGHLTAPEGEGFVRIPLPVLKKIAAQVLNS